MEKLNICLCTIGTRGDVLPFLYLAEELLKKGMSVTMLTNSNWKPLFAHLDLTFIEIADQDPTQTGRNDITFFKDVIMPSFSKTYEAIEKIIGQDKNVCVIYRTGMAGATAAIEAYNLNSMRVMLQPNQVKSFERPSWPLTPLTSSILANINKKLTIPLIYLIGKLRSTYRADINLFRKSKGLKKLALFSKPEHPSFGTVMFCPSWFAMPQTDWPQEITCVGFPYKSHKEALDPRLMHFLVHNTKPIVFTFGTGVESISQLFPMIEEICASLSVPGVILCNDKKRYEFANANVFRCSFAPLDELLPFCSLLIHHGGVGTTAQAIRANIPQVIFPDRFDQPDNAIRIAELELGAAIFDNRVNTEHLVNLFRYLQTNTHIRQRIETLSLSAKSSNAIKDTVTLFMSHLSVSNRIQEL